MLVLYKRVHDFTVRTKVQSFTRLGNTYEHAQKRRCLKFVTVVLNDVD